MNSRLIDLQREANIAFDESYKKIRQSTPREERQRHDAWTTDYAEDADIALRKRKLFGSFARVIYREGPDMVPEMTVSLDPPVGGQYFRHYEHGPDETTYYATSDMRQEEIAQYFTDLLERSEVTRLM